MKEIPADSKNACAMAFSPEIIRKLKLKLEEKILKRLPGIASRVNDL